MYYSISMLKLEKNTTLILKSPFADRPSREAKVIKFNELEVDEIIPSQEGGKGFASVEVSGSNGRVRRLNLFVKEAPNRGLVKQFPEASFKAIAQKWRALKSAKLPVPSTLRTNSKESMYFTSDVTRGGVLEVVDKHRDCGQLGMRLANLTDVRTDLIKVATRAIEAGVFLHRDAFAVVVDPVTRIGEPVLLDFSARTKLLPENGLPQNALRNALIEVDEFYYPCLD